MQVETGIAKILRDHAREIYGEQSLDMTAIMIRGAAHTIDQLTQERDDALAQVQKLLISKRDELTKERDSLLTQILKRVKGIKL